MASDKKHISMEKRSSNGVYFGWWTIWATGIISGMGHGFYGLGISVFFKDISAELGINRAMTSLAAGIGRLEGGLTSPLVGWLSDRYGPRWIIFIGTVIAGCGMVLMYYINDLTSYIVVWGCLIGIGLNIGLTVAVDKSLNDWFIFKRGLAQGTKFALIGVGSVVVIPVVTYLVGHLGWRTTCFIWGLVMLGLSPLLAVFVKQYPPEYYGLQPDGRSKVASSSTELSGRDGPVAEHQIKYRPPVAGADTDFTFKQAVKTRAYWFLAIALGIQMFVVGGVNIHLIPFLTDLGISRAMAGSMMGLMVLATIPSRFFAGIISDRIGKDRLHLLLAGVFFMQTLGLIILLVDQSMISLYFFLGLYGIANGTTTPLFIIALGSYFGRKTFGTIFGSSMVIRAPISLAAPVCTGWIYDTTGSYTNAIIAFTICSAAAFGFMWNLRPALKNQ